MIKVEDIGAGMRFLSMARIASHHAAIIIGVHALAVRPSGVSADISFLTAQLGIYQPVPSRTIAPRTTCRRPEYAL